MNRMRLWVSAAIIAFVILVVFALSVPHTRDVKVDVELPLDTENVPSVVLRDSFKKGIHTISGSFEAPNACTSVNASATLVGDVSSKESILVTISMPSDSGVCLQAPTRTSFQTTVSAPANLPISVTVNGFLASTTSL
ncbi:MAG: hypothetical protein Q8P17_01680 [bacterium]|nr:hypothetical protein [bacterium]